MKALKYLFFLIVIITCDTSDNNEKNTQELELSNETELVNGMNLSYKDLVLPKLECMNMLHPEDSYNYPVYFGMEE